MEEKNKTAPGDEVEHLSAPHHVKWVPRLQGDVEALTVFLDSEQPPNQLVQPTREVTVVYKFGGASRYGFGNSFTINGRVYYSSRQWSTQFGSESSNYRKLANLIYSIEEAHQAGQLINTELFGFTDNSTAEAVYFKGTSSSKKLLELILNLQNLQMHGNVSIHFVHVAGERMNAQGTGGLSRGVMAEGIIQGKSFLSYVPLNKSCLELQPHPLREWVSYWFGGPEEVLWTSPEDWFLRAH